MLVASSDAAFSGGPLVTELEQKLDLDWASHQGTLKHVTQTFSVASIRVHNMTKPEFEFVLFKDRE